MKKRIIQISVVFLGLFALVFYVFKKEGVSQLWNQLASVDYTYVAIALMCMMLSLVADGACIQIVRLKFQPQARLLSSVRCGFISTMFGFITPFQSGYIAGAITYLSSNQGMKPSEASVVTLVKLIYYTIAAIVTHILLIIFNASKFEMQPLLWVFTAVGIGFSVIYMVFLMVVSKFEKPIAAIACYFIRLGARLHIIKHQDKASWKAKVEIHKLKYKLSRIHLGWKSSVLLMICCIISFMAVYFVSWFIYLSFHPSPTLGLGYVLTGNAICQIFQQISPIPGGIGIVDTAFTQIMSGIYGDNLNAAMLLWRLASLYSVILVGFVMLTFTKRHQLRKSV
ncbi:MAG: lysylphosphatidylglycerol synthase transmembrane domain-containing protein [Sphaerochaetaceae bacterium]|jgi:uncharacterized protein (TIRG00374 family)